MAETRIHEAVGVFADPAALDAAVDELQQAGFDRRTLSVAASEERIAERWPLPYRTVEDAEDAPDFPRWPYIAPEAVGDAEGVLIGVPAYLGAVTGAATAAAIGMPVWPAVASALLLGALAGMVGLMAACLTWTGYADYRSRQCRRGGLILWVVVPDSERERAALDILGRNGARDVHAHAV